MDSDSRAVDEVSRLIDQVRSDRLSASPSEARLLSANVTILGPRGTGKSTLLNQVVARSAPDAGLMIPTADPELMHSADTLLGWTLSGMEELLSAEVLDANKTEGTVRRRLTELRRNYALVENDVRQSLANRGLSATEYARDTSTLTPIGMGIARQWSGLLEELAVMLGDEFFVILPVDDVDLSAAALPHLLKSLQLMKHSKRFCAIVCADEATLRTAIALADDKEAAQLEQAISLGLASATSLATQAERKYVKHFPRQYRFKIADVALEDRLTFTPIESKSSSLKDLLKSFPLQNNGILTLADLFVVRDASGASVGPSQYAELFSGNRRDLQQLCSALQSLRSQTDDTRRALEIIIRHVLEQVSTQLPPGAAAAVQIDEAAGGQSVALDVTEIVFGKTAGGGFMIWSPELAADDEVEGPWCRTFVRVIYNFYAVASGSAALGTQGQSDTKVDDDSRVQRVPDRQIPAAFSALMNLCWEGMQVQLDDGYDLLRRGTLKGTFVTPGLKNWFPSLGVRATETPPYLQIPDWEEFSDYYTYQFGWNYLVERLDTKYRQLGAVAITEAVILAHLHLVVDVQTRKCVDLVRIENLIEEAYEDKIAWADQLTARITDVMIRMTEWLGGPNASQARQNSRHEDYIFWLRRGMILCTTRTICSGRFATEMRRAWLASDYVREVDRVAVCEYLANNLLQYVRSEAARGDIELVSFLDERRGRAVANLREALSERMIAAKRSVLNSLRGAAVDEGTLESLEVEGATVSVLAALNSFGIDNESLAQIASYFPPLRQESEMRENDVS